MAKAPVTLAAQMSSLHTRTARALVTKNIPIRDRVLTVFRDSSLPDSLLSLADLKFLFHGTRERSKNIEQALDDLVALNELERDDVSRRPLDDKEVPLWRDAKRSPRRVQVLGLAETLPDGLVRIQLSMNGRDLRSVAQVDTIDSVAGRGEQRDPIKKHIAEIAESVRGGTQIPSAAIIAIDDTAVVDKSSFSASDYLNDSDGEVVIRLLGSRSALIPATIPDTFGPVSLVAVSFPARDAAFDVEKLAYLVDGQQRSAAVYSLGPGSQGVRLTVNAIVCDAITRARIFRVANNTRKISIDHTRALKAIEAAAGRPVDDKAIRDAAVRALVVDKVGKVLHSHVKYPGLPAKGRVLATQTLTDVVEEVGNSVLPKVASDSAVLAMFVDRISGIVAEVWSTDWGKAPSGDAATKGKLMSGTGFRAAMSVALAVTLDERKTVPEKLRNDPTSLLDDKALWARVKAKLESLANHVQWSEGTSQKNKATRENWKWLKEKQVTPTDIRDTKRFLAQIVDKL